MTTRILYSDERPDRCALARDILEAEGYEVVLRSTPFRDAAEMVALHPDLILLALTACHESLGRKTLNLVKTQAASPPVLVFFLGAEDFWEQDRDVMGKPITFVRTPFDLDALLNVIHQALHPHPPG